MTRRTKRQAAQAARDPHEPVGCRYISGDPKGVWSYCQEPQKPGSSMCPRHHAKCHRRATLKEAREIKAALSVFGRAA